MLFLIVNIALFIGALFLLNHKGFDQSTVDLMCAGMVGSGIINGVANIIVGFIVFNPSQIITGVLLGALNLWLFNIFIKRSGV